MMIHQVLGGFRGQGSDIEIHAKETLRIGNLLNEILARHTGQPITRIKKDTNRDYFLTGEQAVKYGLIDTVIDKRN